MIADVYFRPLYSFINRKCNNYFSRTFKFKEPIEYVGKIWSKASFKILGIEYIVENNGVLAIAITVLIMILY